MPPISELTAASELSGTSGSIAPDGGSEGEDAFIVYRGRGYWAPSPGTPPGTPAGASAPPAAPPASGAPGATVG